MHPWIVIKLGGSSQSLEGYGALFRHIRNRIGDHRIAVVLSAVKGVTDKLINCGEADWRSASKIADEILGIHLSLMKKCGLEERTVTSLFRSFQHEVSAGLLPPGKRSNQSRINLLSYGELFSSYICYLFLQKHLDPGCDPLYLDTRWVMRTDHENDDGHGHLHQFCEFKFDRGKFVDLVGDGRVVVCPGFIASTPSGATCLLSRGGGDTSAAIVAHGLPSKVLEIWTDVNGMYSADPNRFPGARIIRDIGYEQAQELAAMGAKVLHPYCILPCMQKRIPIVIRNTYDCDRPEFTTIDGAGSRGGPYAITDQKGIVLFSVTSLNMWNNYGFVHDIFKVFSDLGINVNIITTSQFTISTTTDSTDRDALLRAKHRLSAKYQVEMTDHCSIVSIVGDQIHNEPFVDVAMDKLRRTGHRIHVIHYSANRLSVSFVIDTVHSDSVLIMLAEALERHLCDGERNAVPLTPVPGLQERNGGAIGDNPANGTACGVEPADPAHVENPSGISRNPVDSPPCNLPAPGKRRRAPALLGLVGLKDHFR